MKKKEQIKFLISTLKGWVDNARKINKRLKDKRIKLDFEKQMLKSELRDKVNDVYNLIIPLVNAGEYNRFNSLDYFEKSSNLNTLVLAIEQLRNHYYLNPNSRDQLRRLFNIIDVNYPSLERTSKFLIKLVCGGISSNNRLIDESQKSLFIEIRNFIADEWIYRNIKGPGTKVKKKDLNYLKYTLEEYQRFLENNLNLLIRDTKRFISRYPEEYSKNPDIDVEILKSLRWSVYNDIKFYGKNFVKINEIPKYDLFESLLESNNTELVGKPIKVKGWFKKKPNFVNNYIISTRYKAYKRYRSTHGNKSTLEKYENTLRSYGLLKIEKNA